MKLPYGKFKGKEVSEVASMDKGAGYLNWLKGQLDPNDAKYGEKNKELIGAIDDALIVGKVTSEFNGSYTTGTSENVVVERLGELHKRVMDVLSNQEKILTIIEKQATEESWSE